MNSDQIFQAIEVIAGTSSKNEKQAKVKEYGKMLTFQRVLKASLDPYVTYGIAKLPIRAGGDGAKGVFDADTWDILDQLAKRQLTGNTARDAVQIELSALSHDSADLLSRIIKKDLRAGFSESTVNKAIPGCVPEFNCMLAEKFKDYREDVKYPAGFEPKLDGFRVIGLVNMETEEVRFVSREGHEFTQFEHLKQPLLDKVRNRRIDLMADADEVLILEADSYLQCVFEGEVIAGSFQKTSGDARRKGEQAVDAVYCVFDVLPAVEFNQPGKSGVGKTYRERRKALELMFPVVTGDARQLVRLVPSFTVSNEEEIHALYDKMRQKGFEGGMVKDLNAQYHRRRNKGWLKMKAEDPADLKVVGAYKGDVGKQFANTLGGLLVDHKGVIVKVGGGFEVAERDVIFAALLRDLDKLGLTLQTGVRINGKVLDEEAILISDDLATEGLEVLGRVIEVLYHEVTPDGSLRHPRYKVFRDDKSRVAA